MGCVEAAATLPFAALAHHFTRPASSGTRALRLLYPFGFSIDSTGKREETMTARRNAVAAAGDMAAARIVSSSANSHERLQEVVQW